MALHFILCFCRHLAREKKNVSKRPQAVVAVIFPFCFILKPHLMKAKPASPVFKCIIHPLTEFTCDGTSAIDTTCPAEPPGVGLCNFGCLPNTFSQEHASLKATLEMPKSAPLVWLLKTKQNNCSPVDRSRPNQLLDRCVLESCAGKDSQLVSM